MKIHYFLLRDVIHGRPVIEELPTDVDNLADKHHPDELKKHTHALFLDIEIEDLQDTEPETIQNNQDLQDISDILDISMDALEEIITDQRPRIDEYVDFILILFKTIAKHPIEKDEKKEYQIGLKIYDNVVISIHTGQPIYIPRLFRIFGRNPLLLIGGSITYLTTRYIDALIDPAYDVLESWREISQNLEQKILEEPEKSILDTLVTIRHSLFDVIKIMQANREVINGMRSARMPIFENEYIPPELDDHIKHILDESDILRQIISDLMNMYYSSESSRLNQTLARFTFATSILLLPSLIAGIFGMNNYNFPYLSFNEALGIIFASMIILFCIFKKKRYI